MYITRSSRVLLFSGCCVIDALCTPTVMTRAHERQASRKRINIITALYFQPLRTKGKIILYYVFDGLFVKYWTSMANQKCEIFEIINLPVFNNVAGFDQVDSSF